MPVKVFWDNIEPEFTFTTARSGGPGGQNVNKTETKVLLKWDFSSSNHLTEEQKERMLEKLSTRIDNEGCLSITSTKYRSQLRNKEDVVQKLKELVEKSLEKEKKRKPTKVPKSVKEKRLKEKKVNSETKRLRKKIDP